MLLKPDHGNEAPDETDIVSDEDLAERAASRPDNARQGTPLEDASARQFQAKRVPAQPARPIAGNARQFAAGRLATDLDGDVARSVPPSANPHPGASSRPGAASAARLPPRADRIKRPVDAMDGRRLAEFWAAKQSEKVARKVESSIAATPQLGAVHPNVIMRLMQALMRILRLLFEKLGMHERPTKDGEKKDERGQEAKANVRFHDVEPAPPSSPEPVPAEMPGRAQPVPASQISPEHAQPAIHKHEGGVAADAETVDSTPELTPVTSAADLVTAAIVRLSIDPEVRRRMDEVGPNSSLQTAVYMAAVVNDLRDMARLVEDRLSAYGGAMNLRLASYQAHCQTYGGHTAAALLLQNGVIQPQDVSAAFAEDVKGITARYQPHLDELNLLRLAVTEAAREVYQCAADSPLQEDLLMEMDSSLTDLLGKDWRKSLALERLGAAPDEAEIAQLVQRMDDGPVVDGEHPASAEEYPAQDIAPSVSETPLQEERSPEPESDDPIDVSSPSPAADLTPQPSAEVDNASNVNVGSDTPALSDDGALSHQADLYESGPETMSRDEAMAQFALLETSSTVASSAERAPADEQEGYARERG